MKGEDFLLWILVALLLAAIALTVLFAPGSRHGYGGLTPPAGSEERGAGMARRGGGTLLPAALLDRAVTPRLLRIATT